MSFNLKIEGFKCFRENIFKISKLNVLTGNNGTGKSSLIQSILLSRLIIENTCHINRKGYYSNSYAKGIQYKVELNNNYCLNLGTESDVVRVDSDSSKISFKINDDTIFLSFNKRQTDNLSLTSTSYFQESLNPVKKKEFYYLNAEREGPRHSQKNISFDYLNCGSKGENTAHTILSAETIVNFESALINNKKFKPTLDKWMEFIFPGIIVSAIPISSTLSQIKLRTSKQSSEILSTNIGFGISYALPILVNGLVAQKESLFIVENPEAHLHPKAQSNMGIFLGYLALKNINVIIETHSEHIINGIRKIILNNNIELEDINIFFFKEIDEEKCANFDIIELDKEGNLSIFPIDFFDQVRQDLSIIRNLSINGKPFNLQ